jgi:hypothetical protein
MLVIGFVSGGSPEAFGTVRTRNFLSGDTLDVRRVRRIDENDDYLRGW